MSANPELKTIKACVFDAYGTLFDVQSAAMQCRDVLGDKAEPLATLWRTKQIEYTWLRNQMGEYKDFWHVTGDGLDYAMDVLGLEDLALRSRLMALYFNLDPYPEVADTLKTLKNSGMKTAILSNANMPMLMGACLSAGILDNLDRVLSVDSVGVFKVMPQAYQLACDQLALEPADICFMSSNAWDQAGAAHFGFRVVRVNRAGLPPEKIPGKAIDAISNLSELPSLLGL